MTLCIPTPTGTPKASAVATSKATVSDSPEEGNKNNKVNKRKEEGNQEGITYRPEGVFF